MPKQPPRWALAVLAPIMATCSPGISAVSGKVSSNDAGLSAQPDLQCTGLQCQIVLCDGGEGATLSGVAFYRAKGYADLEPMEVPLGNGEALPILRMAKNV